MNCLTWIFGHSSVGLTATPGKESAGFRLLLGGCVLQQGTNLGCAGGYSSTWRTHQVDRFAAIAIDNLSFGAFLKQVANEIRVARLRRHVKSGHAFVGRWRAGVTHGIRLRTGDLSIHVRAVLKKYVH